MFHENLFHGVNNERAIRFINNNKMQKSVGDNHWLGDGSYFFKESFYSFKWIVDMCLKRYPDYSETILKDNYKIIIGEIITERYKVFDLTQLKYKLIFDNTCEQIIEKKKLSKKYRDSKVAEGVVVNYLFNELGYLEEFDVVKAIFTLYKEKYSNLNTRIGFIPQEQICVKNLSVIKKIEEYDYKDNLEEYQYTLKNMYPNDDDEEGPYYKTKKHYKYKKVVG